MGILDKRYVAGPLALYYAWTARMMGDAANSVYHGIVPRHVTENADAYFRDPGMTTGRLIAFGMFALLFGAMTAICAYKAVRPTKTDF